MMGQRRSDCYWAWLAQAAWGIILLPASNDVSSPLLTDSQRKFEDRTCRGFRLLRPCTYSGFRPTRDLSWFGVTQRCCPRQ